MNGNLSEGHQPEGEQVESRKILLLTTDVLVAAGLPQVIPDSTVLAAESADEALNVFRDQNPDMVVIDLFASLRPEENIELIGNVKALSPKTVCVVYAGRTQDTQLFVRAVSLGADAYVEQIPPLGLSWSEFLAALPESEPYYAGFVVQALVERYSRIRLPGSHEAITDRETDILQLVSTGKRNQEIADQLNISLPTVKSHLGHIFSKMGVTNRRDAVKRARKLNLFRSDQE